MTKITDIVLNDLHNSRFLLDVDTFVVDIETDTEAPEGSVWEGNDKYGLSYCADVTHVSFYAGEEFPVVVFTLPKLESSLKYTPEEHELQLFNEREKLEFIRTLFSRDMYRVIGHNIIFDLRNLLGHLGFDSLPHNVEVWDTLSMGQRTLFSESGQSGLQHLTEKWELNKRLVFHEKDRDFYDIMKVARKGFSQIPELLKSSNFSVWKSYADVHPGGFLAGQLDLDFTTFYGGIDYDPQDPPDLTLGELMEQPGTNLSQDNYNNVYQNIISHYVAMDVVYTWRLYRLQLMWTSNLAKQDTMMQPSIGRPIHLPRWRQLPELVDRDMNICRISANQAIRGIKLDIDFVHHSIDRYTTALLDETVPIFQTHIQEDIDRYVKIAALRWYENIMHMLDSSNTYSKPKMLGVESETEYHDVLDPNFLDFAFRGRTDVLEFIQSLTANSTRKTVLDGLGEFSFSEEEEDYFLSLNLVGEYLRNYGRTVDAYKEESVKDMAYFYYEDWMRYVCEKKIEVVDYINKGKFKPYFLFTVSQIDLPNEEDIIYTSDLTTAKFKKLLQEAQDNYILQPERGDLSSQTVNPMYEQYVVDMKLDIQAFLVGMRGFSLGKKAISFYIDRDLDDPKTQSLYKIEEIQQMGPLALFRLQLQLIAMISRSDEFLRHAARDGRIHPLLVRDTTTGRFSSKDPNIQNVKMSDRNGFAFVGYLIADDGYWLVECDYSNAENVMGAMISGDHNFAHATETGDFHLAQTKIYWPEEYSALEAEGNFSGIKSLRNDSKPVTFSESYGAGPKKIAQEAKMDIQDVFVLLENKKKAYPALYAKKKEAEDKCLERYKKGYYPAYTVLWNGARVPVTIFEEEKYGRTVYGGLYVCWNYIQQGGVSELICGSLIDIDRYLYEQEAKTFITLNVHDSLLPAVALEEYETILPMVFQIMGSQVPEKLLYRTCPPVHFVSEVGPENAKKWGYRWKHEYPFSKEHFVNQWGVHQLPDKELEKDPSEREAPTWRGPVHLGWTIEQDIIKWKLQHATTKNGGSVSTPILPTTVEELSKASEQVIKATQDYQNMLKELAIPRDLTYLDTNGESQTIPLLKGEEYLAAAEYIASVGVADQFYLEILAKREAMLDSQKHLQRIMEV